MSSSRRLLVPLGAAISVLAIVAGSVQRIPSSAVGIGVTRVAHPGWRFHAPFRPLAVVPVRGQIAVDDLRLTTREGSRLVFRLDLAYEIGARLAPPFVADLRASGLSGALAVLARHVLEDAGLRADTETLLSTPSLVEAPLRAALEGAGVGVARLSFRSPLGDEVVRRRATETARALVRPALARVLVIGWDGADWRSIRPLVAAGRMPNLARLLSEGASGDLRSYDPMYSPLIWTTVATGKAPTEHGIADFLVKDVTADKRRPISSDFRKVKALWNIFGDFDRRSAWVGWWASYPAESIDGVIVSDLLSASVNSSGPDKASKSAGVASPAEFLPPRAGLLQTISALTRDDVARFFSLSEADWRHAQDEIAHPPPKTQNRDQGKDDPAVFMAHVLNATRNYHALAKDLVRSGMPFVAVYYEGIDIMGHRFQHFLPPKMDMVSEADYERFKDAVPRWYELQDEMLGDLLSVTPKDTVVMILSDHGFLTGESRPEGLLPYTKLQPAEWHDHWGIVVLHGPGIRAGQLPAASVYDIAPTLLYLEGLPLAEDMPGRLIAAALAPTAAGRVPPPSIRTYELAGSRLEQPTGNAVDSAAMDEMMANLRALGYVGGDPASPVAGGAEAPRDDAAADKIETQYYFHRNLAVSYIRQGRYKEAESELLAANQRTPAGKTYSLLSEVRATEGRYLDAASALEDGWRTAPTSMDPSTMLWMVELHLLASDEAGASESLSRWSPKMTPAARAAAQGRLQDAGGDPAGAASLYLQALQQDPLLVGIAQRLHEIDVAAGRPFAIEPFLLRTLAAHPKVDAYWDLAGQLALARGDAVEAAPRFRKACDLQPENGLYLGHRASACAAAGREGEAREALAWAERFPPREPDAWMAIGAAWDRLREPDRALAAFGAARKAGLLGPGADMGEALALMRAGRASEARRVLDEALRRFPQNPVLRQLRERLGT
jgi:predicted AlkP superfamily phosphohydrolase/phosphomutase/tetratricopeptide (TPR) repeat protein